MKRPAHDPVQEHSQAPQERRRRAPAYRYCVECLGPYKPRPRAKKSQRWCSDACLQKTERRWRSRAAAAYHLISEGRYNRTYTTWMSDLSTLFAQWRQEDEREGRITHDPRRIPVIGKIYRA